MKRARILTPLASLLLGVSGSAQWTATESAKLIASDPGSKDEFGRAVAVDGDTGVVGASQADHAAGVDAGAAYVYERDQGGPDAWGEVRKLVASNAALDDEFGEAVAIDGDTIVVGASLGFGEAVYVFERDHGGPGAWGETAVLTSGTPFGNDRFGAAVDVSQDTIVVGAFADDTVAFLAGAAYVYERNAGGPGAWGVVATLTASDGATQDRFGLSVAVWSDGVVIGAPEDSHSGIFAPGSAYVFERDLGGPNAWGELTKLIAEDATLADGLGQSIAAFQDTVVAGAPYAPSPTESSPGAAYVFHRDGGGPGAWGQVSKLLASDGDGSDSFGWSVSISGSAIVVGAFADDHVNGGPILTREGAAYLFEREQGGPGAWGEILKLTASDAAQADWFGFSVGLSEGTTVVGSIQDDHVFASAQSEGSAYVFEHVHLTETYCTAGVSGGGCAALLSAAGTASATAASGFTLSAATVEGGRNGMLFFGTGGRQANPWGNGGSYQCVVPPVKRAGLLNAAGTSGQCDGAFSQDLNAHWSTHPTQNPGAAAVVQAQLWYRDPQNTSNQTTSLSDAIELQVGP